VVAGDESAQYLICVVATNIGIALEDVAITVNRGVIIFGEDVLFDEVFLDIFLKTGEDVSSVGAPKLALETINNRKTLSKYS